jgi:hypothetical protein
MTIGDMVLRCYPHEGDYHDESPSMPRLVVNFRSSEWGRYDVLWSDGYLTTESTSELVGYAEEMSAINEKRSVQASLKA